ncbi:MAG: TonB-dependent siderophore receptor [Paracoccus sp. (in: a-proteobacteria)]|nr:TonB-dependent siderophore receptor [Paracoccus sp. (in: a-proteobacteria)]
MTTSFPPNAGFSPTLGLLPVLAMSVTTAASLPAAAQQSPYVLPDIALTGAQDDAATTYNPRRASSPLLTQELLDTPRSVQIITRRQIDERGASSVYDVLRTTPGVTLGTGEGGNPMGDRPFIRGYEASTDMMVDGMRQLGRTSHEAFNIEQIEMVRGAGGAYSGRGGVGGSLNMVTKQARIGEEFNEASAMIGNASQSRLTLDSNFALGERAAGRVNLMWQDSEVPGRGGLRDDKTGVALALSGQLTETTQLSFSGFRSRAKNTPDFGIPMANEAYVTATGDTSYGTGTTSDPYQPLGSVNHDQFFGLFNRDRREVTNTGLQLRLEHEFSPSMRLRAQLGYVGSEQEYIVTRPTFIAGADGTGALQRASRSGARDTSAVGFALSLSGEAETGGISHSYVIGTEISREKLRSASLSGFPSGTSAFDTSDWRNPDPWVPVDMSGLTRGPWGDPTITRSVGFYAFDTLSFNDQWEASLGVRHENFDVDQQGNGLRRKDGIWSYQVGVVYKPAANGSIYVNYGTSASPSGQCAGLAGGSEGAGACTLTANNDDLAPEKVRSFEIGTKWDVMDDLFVTAALFRTEKTNARVTDPFGNVDTIGRNRAQGLELGVNGQISERWGISAGYALTDARIIDAGYVDDGSGNYVASPDNGNRMHYIARNSFALWTTYEMDDQWTFGGGATYTGKRFMNAANTAELPAQWRVDAMAAYQINDQARLQMNINNLFDENLYDASHVGLFANVQAGRSVTLKLDYSF